MLVKYPHVCLFKWRDDLKTEEHKHVGIEINASTIFSFPTDLIHFTLVGHDKGQKVGIHYVIVWVTFLVSRNFLSVAHTSRQGVDRKGGAGRFSAPGAHPGFCFSVLWPRREYTAWAESAQSQRPLWTLYVYLRRGGRLKGSFQSSSVKLYLTCLGYSMNEKRPQS